MPEPMIVGTPTAALTASTSRDRPDCRVAGPLTTPSTLELGGLRRLGDVDVRGDRVRGVFSS
jgi:hypothetical protein